MPGQQQNQGPGTGGLIDGIMNGINTAANVAGTIGSFFGGGQEGLSKDDQRFMAHQSWTLARDQFEKPMQVRARDAEAAGLHPLAALGVMPSSSSVATAFAPESKPNLGDRLNNMGQNISRAISAYQTAPERELAKVRLDNEKAQGDLIRANTLESLKRAQDQPSNPPALPGQPMLQKWWNPVTKTVEWGYSPEYAASIMSSPLSMYAKDVKNIAGNYSGGGHPTAGYINELLHAAKRLNPLNWWDMRKRR